MQLLIDAQSDEVDLNTKNSEVDLNNIRVEKKITTEVRKLRRNYLYFDKK